MNAEQILRKREKLSGGDMTYWQQNWIIDAMEEYKSLSCAELSKEVERLTQENEGLKFDLDKWKYNDGQKV